MLDLETVDQVAEQFRDAAAEVLTGRPEGDAALKARHSTDPETLARVADILHAQLGGIARLLVRERVNAAGEPMERRTVTRLHWTGPAS
jgi:hypothetical protein